MNEEKPKKSKKEKAVEDVEKCTFEGTDIESCVTEAQKTHGLTDEEAGIVKWEAAKGKKK